MDSVRLQKTTFIQSLISINALQERFQAWVFHPGMLFGSLEKWWVNGTSRIVPHEGLDLCLYRDRAGNEQKLGQKVKIPAIWNGRIVGIIEDFLGKSIIMDHGATDDDGECLCTIFGHVLPCDNVAVGTIADEGAIIASIASPKEGSAISPHLHVSVALKGCAVAYEDLDWANMTVGRSMRWIDPMPLVGENYVMSK